MTRLNFEEHRQAICALARIPGALLASGRTRICALGLAALIIAVLNSENAGAEFPFSRGGSSADPYAYEDYMFITDAEPESGSECMNAIDDDANGLINDGCPGPETVCHTPVDEDGDGLVNDGCPGVDPGIISGGESGSECANILDDDGDGVVNDGCPTDRSEIGAQCANALDEDGDGLVNDGCLAQYPPTDLGGEAYKYSSKNACELYGNTHLHCDPAINANPQELNGVMGASVDLAWKTTTGRPDVVIAVHDSGIRWNDGGFLIDLNNKTWLNRGELPIADWGSPHPSDPYDRNSDGIFNILDYCPNAADELNCGGSGDSRVRGSSTTNDTDYNANGWIDPEDLIFKFSDGVDDDANGYVDDFVGWDTFEDDNDPFDEVQYGHGTGEARDSTAEVNNGGDAGVCPNCMVMHMRVGDSFVADVNDFAQGVLYATDNGASVIQSALGTLNNSRFAQEAIDYAYRRGVVLIASAADESAGHHNQPSVLEHGVTFNAIGNPERLDDREPPGIPSYLEFRGCTNYGAYITAAVPANSCSSEAVGRTAGMAGLIYSSARNQVALGNIDDYQALNCLNSVTVNRGVSAEEVDQLISTTADDINFITPVLYTARPDLADTERYPASEGWDPFFGYGRVNADRMVTAVAQNKIPPEADITSPKWFATVDIDDGPIEIEGSAASCRSDKYSYAVRWGVWSWRQNNAAPSYSTQGVTLTFPGDQTSPKSGVLATIDPTPVGAALTLANGPQGAFRGPAVDPATGRGDHENLQYPDKFGIIVQLEVTSKDSTGTPLLDIDGQPLTGIGTKNFNFHDDPALFPGFPIDLGGDGAASPRFADIDDDGVDELIVATSDGEVHAYESGGGEVPGWPVALSPLPAYGGPAYSSAEITPPHAAVLRSPSIGDIDRNGDLEVVVGDFEGRLWVLEDDGQVRAGFPKRANPDFSYPRPDERAAGYYASASHPNLVPGDYPGPGASPEQSRSRPRPRQPPEPDQPHNPLVCGCADTGRARRS